MTPTRARAQFQPWQTLFGFSPRFWENLHFLALSLNIVSSHSLNSHHFHSSLSLSLLFSLSLTPFPFFSFKISLYRRWHCFIFFGLVWFVLKRDDPNAVLSILFYSNLVLLYFS